MSSRFHVAGIGNAIVDVIATCEDDFISKHALNKGAMTLIEAERAEELYALMPPGIEMSGGSCANTIAGIASLGGQSAYIGKVCEDQLGAVFAHDVRALGVHFDTAPIKGQPPTARCLILVTPDAERTMNTYLGACVELTPDDVDEEIIAAAQVTYMEGYLWDRPEAKEAYLKAAATAHDAGRRVSLTLSDTFCVERHRESFRDLVRGHVDILFANEDEIMALYEVDSFEAAVEAVRGDCEMVALTRSEKGAVILAGTQHYEIPARTFGRVVDTTGAGDLFAAGFLAGLTQGRHLAECGKMGVIAAGEIISHVGARPERPLARLMEEEL